MRLGSVGALIAGVIVLKTRWYQADAIVTVLICGGIVLTAGNSVSVVDSIVSTGGGLSVTATDLTGGGSIAIDFETEAVMNAAQVAERSSALRLLTVS